MSPIETLDGFSLRVSLKEYLPANLIPFASDLDVIKGLARFSHAQEDELCFCDRQPPNIENEDRSTVLCTTEIARILAERAPFCKTIVANDPRAEFIDLARHLLKNGLLEPSRRIPRPFGISPSAQVGFHTAIHPETRIDDDVIIGSHCVIHRGTWLQPGVMVGDGSIVGHSGINAYRTNDGRLLDFPHLAGVIVGSGTSIGANSVVVGGILTSTVIGNNVTIGNLCNIGHGVEIGQECWMSVGCKIGGHTVLGEQATLGMGALLRDNLQIGARAQIGMGSVVVKNVNTDHSVFGNPARSVPPITAGPIR